MRKWRWVSRGINSGIVLIWKLTHKPTIHNGSFLEDHDKNEVAAICAKEFKRLVGICPKPGECLKVEFGKAKVVK